MKSITLPILKILWTSRFDYQPTSQLNDHAHDYYQIIFICSGTGTFRLGQEIHDIAPGKLFLIRPNVFHGLTADRSLVLKTLDIKFEASARALKTMLSTLPEVTITNDLETRTLLEKIRNEGEAKLEGYQDLCAVHLMEILINLGRQQSQHSSLRPAIPGHILEMSVHPAAARSIAYMQENYASELSLRQIVEHANCTQRHLCQLFSRLLKTSPISFLHAYRIDRAKELILYSDYALKQIASMVGFKSIHHFTRHFSRLAGSPPASWRKRERDGIRKDVYFEDKFVNVNKIKR